MQYLIIYISMTLNQDINRNTWKMICRGFKEHVSSDEANDSKCQSAELSQYGEFESPKIYIKKNKPQNVGNAFMYNIHTVTWF